MEKNQYSQQMPWRLLALIDKNWKDFLPTFPHKNTSCNRHSFFNKTKQPRLWTFPPRDFSTNIFTKHQVLWRIPSKFFCYLLRGNSQIFLLSHSRKILQKLYSTIFICAIVRFSLQGARGIEDCFWYWVKTCFLFW